MMLFGISGSSGSGKTSLARRLSEDLGIEYRSASITSSGKRHGFDPVGILTLDERVALQYHLLSDHIELLEASPRPLIIDRTPIDMIAYLMGEFHMHSHMVTDERTLQAAAEYVSKAIEVTVRYYDQVFLLSPLPTYEEMRTRPATNPAYQIHTHLLMSGAMTLLRDRVSYFTVNTPDLEKRVAGLSDIIIERLDDIEKERRSAKHIH